MASFFDGLLNATQNPLFLGGANLLMGGGPQGMMQGMQMGNQMQQQRRQQEAVGGALAGMNMSDGERQFFASNPEAATQLLSRIYAEKMDPMAATRRRMAEAQLKQTELENQMFPLRQKQIEAQIAQSHATAEQGKHGRYGLQLFYGVDAQGNPVAMQAGPNGEAVQTKLPEGVTLDLAARARESAAGKATGEARVNLPGSEYNAKKLVQLIDGVLSDPYLENMTGPIAGRLPNISGAANRVQSKLDQIQGKTFLAAYEALKGGGQITEIEGAKAEASMQRLQNAKVGTQDFIEAAREFRKDVLDLLEVSRAKASGNYRSPQQGSGGSWGMRRID